MHTLNGIRRIVDLLKDADVCRLWITGSLIGVVRWTEILVLGIYTFNVTASPLTVAVIAFLNAIPGALFGAFMGTLGERFDRRILLLIGLSGVVVLYAVLLILAHTEQLELWHIGVGTFLAGCMWTTEYPVRRTLLGEVAGISRAPTALTLDIATGTLTMFIGPLIGGLLLQDFGLGAFYALGAGALVFACVLVFSVRFIDQRQLNTTQPFTQSLIEGIAHARQNRPIAGVLLVTVAMNFFGFSYLSMIPVIGAEKLLLGPGAVGVLGSMEGAGACLGLMVMALYATSRHYMRLFIGGSLILLLMIALFSVIPWFVASAIVLLVAGLGESGFGGMQATITFIATPSEMRSRIMGLLVVCIGFGPLGILHTGLMAQWLGADVAVGIIAVEGLAAMALCLWKLPVLRLAQVEPMSVPDDTMHT